MASHLSGDKAILKINDIIVNFDESDHFTDFNVFEYEASNITCLLDDPVELEIEDQEDFIKETRKVNEWIWTPADVTGLSKLTIKDIQKETYIRIYPSKVTQEQYEYFIQEISNIAYGIVFDVYSPVCEYAKVIKSQNTPTVQSDYEKLNAYFIRLKKCILSISRNPHKCLKSITELLELTKAKNIDPKTINYIASNHNEFNRFSKGLSPLKVITRSQIISYDVYENRFIKLFLNLLIVKLNRIIELAKTEKREREESKKWKDQKKNEVTGKTWWENEDKPRIQELEIVIKNAIKLKLEINKLKKLYFIDKIGEVKELKISQVFQKVPDYTEVYKLCIDFQRTMGINFESDNILIKMKPISKIYEYFCLLKIYESLKDIGFQPVETKKIFKTNEKNRYVLDIEENSLIVFTNPNYKITLYYDHKYPREKKNEKKEGFFSIKPDRNIKSPNRPDFSLIIETLIKDSSPIMIIMDAKYTSDSMLEKRERDVRDYLNTIRFLDHEGKKHKIVKSSHVLYPGKINEPGEDFEYEFGVLSLNKNKDITEDLKLLINNAIKYIE